jgi:hypothetical protein
MGFLHWAAQNISPEIRPDDVVFYIIMILAIVLFVIDSIMRKRESKKIRELIEKVIKSNKEGK